MVQHIVPTAGMVAPYILTGYETIVPIKAGGKFATIAKEDGTVKDLTKNNITVEYKSGKTESYRLYSWTSKEESGSCYTHEIVPNLEVGQKFLKDDTIAYDKLFFEPCIFSPRRVIYKQGALVNVMLSEDPQTYEDSMAMSTRLQSVLGTTMTKVKSIVIDKSATLSNLIQIGKATEPSTPLVTILTGELPAGVSDKDLKDILTDISKVTPKAKVQGKVSKILIYYNFDKEEASETVQSLIDYSDKILKQNYGYPGRVTTGYSIAGKPLEEGKAEIKIYIDVKESMGTGDKCILGSQLKCTVGEVFEYDLVTESGDLIDAVFSNTSISARIVNSPNLIGTTSTLLKKLEEQCLKLYFG